MKDVIHQKIPCESEELKLFHKMAKENALAIYKKKAIGDI